MNNKKSILAAIVLVVLVAAMAVVWFVTRPETEQGSKAFTVTVVHKDGLEKVFEYRTDAEHLGTALLEKELISGYEDTYGLVVEYVDGERAAWDKDNAFWSIYIGEEEATLGISKIPVYDGSTFKLVYTPLS